MTDWTAWELLSDEMLVVSFGSALSGIRFDLSDLYLEVRDLCRNDYNTQLPVIHNEIDAEDLDPFECRVQIHGTIVARKIFQCRQLTEDQLYEEEPFDLVEVREFVKDAIAAHSGVFRNVDWDRMVLEVEKEGSISAYKTLISYYGTVKRDAGKRFHYLKKMAALGSPVGCAGLRRCYLSGDGTEKDPVAGQKILMQLKGPPPFSCF